MGPNYGNKQVDEPKSVLEMTEREVSNKSSGSRSIIEVNTKGEDTTIERMLQEEFAKMER